MAITGPVLLVGCGRMGTAMLGRWKAAMSADQIKAVEPVKATAKAVRLEHGIEIVADCAALDPTFSPRVVVFAIKPQAVDKVIPSYQRFAGPDTVFLSIIAGKPIASLAKSLGDDAAIVRAMPNTPAVIGRGISVIYSNDAVTVDQRDDCRALLLAVGAVEVVEEEAMLDAVTAVSGSGPAYVFFLIECLIDAAVKAGLSPPLAQTLTLATVSGAGELAFQSPKSIKTLRHDVTSPNGTTQAALDVLMADDGLKPLIRRAVADADKRSRALAG